MCIRDSFLPVHFHNGHRELCALFLVEAQEVGVVLLADLVAGQDDDVLGIIAVDEADVLSLIHILYGDLKYRDKLEYVTNYSVPVGWRSQYCGLFKADVDGVT